jgi:phospholipase/carboxylesterase
MTFEKIDFSKPNFAVKHPQNGKAKYLMIFLHGYGSDGNDLIGLSNVFDKTIPQTIYLSPNAPNPTGFGGYQWFPISSLSNRELETGTLSIAPYVHHFIDEALAFYDISPENLILAGFSQGAMIAMHIGIERKIVPTAVFAYSGALTAIEGIEKRIQSRPPIFLCHGANDDVVLPQYTIKAAEVLTALGVTVEKHIIAHYPHTIPPEGLVASVKFLNTHIKPIATG